MIRCRFENDFVQIHVSCERPPRIYFDQFALYHFSSRPLDQERFLRLFERKGELLFSHINMFEVASLRGRSASLVRNFLAAIGGNWVPIEFDAFKVTTELLTWSPNGGTPHPALGGSLLQTIYEASPGPVDNIELAALVDRFVAEDPRRNAEFMAFCKKTMAANIDVWRGRYLADPSNVEAQFPIVTGMGPVMKIFTALLRVIVKESKSHAWMPNDAFDFVHCVVPLACSDIIFLDKHWKRRVQQLPADVQPKRIYYGQEVEDFLKDFESDST